MHKNLIAWDSQIKMHREHPILSKIPRTEKRDPHHLQNIAPPHLPGSSPSLYLPGKSRNLVLFCFPLRLSQNPGCFNFAWVSYQIPLSRTPPDTRRSLSDFRPSVAKLLLIVDFQFIAYSLLNPL
jgi:hypothetical protein